MKTPKERAAKTFVYVDKSEYFRSKTTTSSLSWRSRSDVPDTLDNYFSIP